MKISRKRVFAGFVLMILGAGRAFAQSEPEIRMLYTVKDPQHRLVLADANGVEVKAINGLSMNSQWSPDGERIFVQLEPEEKFGDDILAVMGLDFKIFQAKGQYPEMGFRNPTWTPDGKSILLTLPVYGVERIGVDDESAEVVCEERADLNVSGAFPSPDGTKLAVTGYLLPREVGKENDVFITAPDCSGAVRLTTDMPRAWEIRWSPDGKRITFLDRSAPDVVDNKIIVMDANGANRRQFKEGYHLSVSWTGDGRLLTTWIDMSTPKESRVCTLAIIDPATGLATPLRKEVEAFFNSAEWRPDGAVKT